MPLQPDRKTPHMTNDKSNNHAQPLHITEPADGGKLIVLTAPLTETIDHAGYFIQMGMASMPIWMEGWMTKKYPRWREVEYNPDASARYMPAGVRLVEAALLREFRPDDIVCCYPDDLDKFIGPDTRVVAVSTHNPLGVTFAAGVYTSIFGKAIKGEELPREVEVGHPKEREALLVPDRRTTFGVVEMTTGCGRRCQFCLPDLNPQIDVPKDRIMAGVRANVREGNKQISLATEDMFIWGQVHTDTPFYFPNREALLDLYSSVVTTPGVEQHVLSHATIAPSVVDPVLIRKISETVLDKSPIRLPLLSTHPEKRALVPLIGLETGSVRLAKQIMPSKGVPFPIEEWPSVVVNGLKVLNEQNWFPAMTLIVGSPGENDEDTKATIDLVCEVERRGLFAFFIPSVFTPLHDTRMEKAVGVTETRQLTPLQWQLMMKCWKMNLRPGQMSWWGPMAWRTGAIALWLYKLRKLNGPHFTWPLLMFASALPESVMARLGKIHRSRAVPIKSRSELLTTIRPSQRRYLRADTGDMPEMPPVETTRRLLATIRAADVAAGAAPV